VLAKNFMKITAWLKLNCLVEITACLVELSVIVLEDNNKYDEWS